MNAHTDMLLWVDTETTDTDPVIMQLLEIGLRVTTMQGQPLDGLTVTVPKSNIIIHTPHQLTAIRMHTDNHLLQDCLTAANKNHTPAEALDQAADFIRRYATQYTLHPAGTNPDFDLQALKTMPQTASALRHVSYRKLDMSTLRLLQLAGDGDPYGAHEPGSHRVDDCLDRDIAEYQEYMASRPASHRKGTAS